MNNDENNLDNNGFDNDSKLNQGFNNDNQLNTSLTNNVNNLFPEVEEKNANKDIYVSKDIDYDFHAQEPKEENQINLEETSKKPKPKKPKKSKENINPIDDIMNPKKKKKEADITFVFLLFLLILVGGAIYLGVTNNIVNLKMFGFNLKEGEMTCYFEDIQEVEGKTEKHIFKYKGKTITSIKSMYAFAAKPDRLNRLSKSKEDIMAEAIGLPGIKYSSEISENTYKIWASYDIKKINFKVYRDNNNSGNRITLIDVASDMKIDPIKKHYEEKGFLCYVGNVPPEDFEDQTDNIEDVEYLDEGEFYDDGEPYEYDEFLDEEYEWGDDEMLEEIFDDEVISVSP